MFLQQCLGCVCQIIDLFIVLQPLEVKSLGWRTRIDVEAQEQLDVKNTGLVPSSYSHSGFYCWLALGHIAIKVMRHGITTSS